jgi:hypothetical protein
VAVTDFSQLTIAADWLVGVPLQLLCPHNRRI